MRKLYIFVICLYSCQLLSQEIPFTDAEVKNKVLAEINQNFETKAATSDSLVSSLDSNATKLDRAIAVSRNASDKANKLLERVQELEKKQGALEEHELNVYQTNYQSALINLVSMDREIKPLMLFNATKDFFSAMSNAANPMAYQEYSAWFEKFKLYIEQQKSKEAGLNLLSTLLNTTSNISSGVNLSGPMIQPLLSGINSYITSLSNSKKELRMQSEGMFLLTAKLAQFKYDQSFLETEWIAINDELNELQSFYQRVLSDNLTLINISDVDFAKYFTNENDAFKRYEYLSQLKQISADMVTNSKISNPKEWKETVYYQMQDVQSLKQRFGMLTFRISENIERYLTLIDKYKTDQQLALEISKLETKLSGLKDIFEQSFVPITYVNSAQRMYKVN